jgi:hypothetical protein
MFVILGFLSLINFALINSHYMLVAFFSVTNETKLSRAGQRVGKGVRISGCVVESTKRTAQNGMKQSFHAVRTPSYGNQNVIK